MFVHLIYWWILYLLWRYHVLIKLFTDCFLRIKLQLYRSCHRRNHRDSIICHALHRMQVRPLQLTVALNYGDDLEELNRWSTDRFSLRRCSWLEPVRREAPDDLKTNNRYGVCRCAMRLSLLHLQRSGGTSAVWALLRWGRHRGGLLHTMH